MRTVEAGDIAPGGGAIEIEPAIEVGNIFKLGTRYSEPLGATFLDENGEERPIVMGSYGIGPARIVAAAIEQRADERGIVWPRRDRALAGPPRLARQGRRARARGRRPRSTRSCAPPALEVLYDDRDAGPGEKLTDAELLGCPLRIVVGRRGLADGVVEAAERASGAEHELPVEEAAERAAGPPPGARCLRRAPFGRGRLRRLLRARPQRAQTAADAQGRAAPPLDDPQLRRLRPPRRDPGLPLPRLRIRRRRARSPPPMVFWLIAAGDYLDGFLARVTGQYSRMGALLDPLIDRLTILSGAVVCWSFELLPRWALALLALRELAMLCLAQYGLRHGVDIEVNWPGRISVFPIMGGIFFALLFAGWVPTALLVSGLALAILATVLYARTGSAARCAAPRCKLSAKSAQNLQPAVEPWARLDL